MTARLSDEEREQVRRMAYAGSYSREKADRNVATIERILAARLAEAEQAAEQRERERVLTAVEVLADVLQKQGEEATARRSYVEGVEKKHAAGLVRALADHLRDGDGKANAGAPSVLVAYGDRDARVLASGPLPGHYVDLTTPTTRPAVKERP